MKDTNKETSADTNVVSLFASRDAAKKKADSADSEDSELKNADGETFADIVAKNLANKERVKRERKNANKSVLRSYRIKN